MSEEQPMDSIKEANYIKLNGRVFSITPIANSDMDIEAELKQFYNEKYKVHIANFNGGIVTGLTDDWDRQISKLQEHNRRSTVTVPEAMMGKYMICTNGHNLEEVKGIIYSPNVFKMVRRDVAQWCHIEGEDEEDEDEDGNVIRQRIYPEVMLDNNVSLNLNDYNDDEVLLVTVRRKIFHCALYSFDASSDRMSCTNLKTFHNQGTRICTGSHRASEFWASPNFAELMNQVNCFSLGSQYVTYRDGSGNNEYTVGAYVKRSTILSVQPERSTQWRT